MPQQSQSSIFSGPISERAPHEEELERKRKLLARVRTIRDGINLNRATVEGDPSMEYLWVNTNESRQIYFQGLGWTKVTSEDTDVKTRYRQDDGTHVRGDLILYKMEKELAEAYQLDNIIKGMEQIEGNKSAFRTTAAKDGIPTFIPNVA